jgi:soluble lytic murein transglycosylase-like protein
MPANHLSRPALALAVLVALLAVPTASPAAGTGTGGALASDAHSHASTGDDAVRPTKVGGMSADDTISSPAPAPARRPAAPVAAPTSSKGRLSPADVPYGALIAAVAREHAIPVSLFTALVWQESGFRARARSKAGARGLTQLMPGTARDLGVRRIYDPAENLAGGAHYLKAQLVRFGSVKLALAAYNAGPEAVAKFRGIPPYAETRQYVRNILAIDARLRAAGVR